MPQTAFQNDTYQVRVVGRIEGQETNNIFYFRCISGAGDSDVHLHLILVFLQCFIDHLLPVLSSAWNLERIVWKKVYPSLGPEIISVPTGSTQGGGAATALPSFCSAVVSIRTQFGGRSRRGRTYYAGIPENATVGSTLDPTGAFWTAILAFAACVIEKFVAGDPPGTNAWAMMMYSRKLGGSTFPLGNAGFEAVTEYVPVSLLGTTRSRKVGRGS